MRQLNYPSGQSDSLNEYSHDVNNVTEQELCEYDAEYLYHKNTCRHQRQLEAIRRRQHQRKQSDQEDNDQAKRKRLLRIALGLSVTILGQLLLSSTAACSTSNNSYRIEGYTINQADD